MTTRCMRDLTSCRFSGQYPLPEMSGCIRSARRDGSSPSRYPSIEGPASIKSSWNFRTSAGRTWNAWYEVDADTAVDEAPFARGLGTAIPWIVGKGPARGNSQVHNLNKPPCKCPLMRLTFVPQTLNERLPTLHPSHHPQRHKELISRQNPIAITIRKAPNIS